MTRTLSIFILLVALPVAAAPDGGAPAVAVKAPDPAAAIAERAQALKEASELLDKASAARTRGNRNFAEQLFSSAELIVGPDAVAELAGFFREGAPPRVNTPLKTLPKDTPAQPAVVGNSDDDAPEEKPKKGSLAGTVRLEGKAPIEGLAVVTLEPASGKWRRRTPRTKILEQRDRQFAPRVLAVPVGSTVTFPNFDNVYHNVFSRSDSKSFDLGIYKGGAARDVVFDKEGIIRLGCNLHANMAAHIIVVAAPHYAVTDSTGHFRFKSLEPGKYKLKAWNEKSTQPVVRDVVIAPDKNTVSVVMAADASAGLGTDKFGVARGGKP